METSREPRRVVQILLTVLVFKATRMLGLEQPGAALRLAQAQVGPETGGHLNAAPRTNDSTRIARNR